MLTALMSLLLAGQVSIYVGPMTRDGFVDADTGINDSVSDLRAALGKKGMRVVDKEADAALKLYVVGRVARAAPSGVSTGTVAGTSVVGTSIPFTVRTIDTILRVGDYERPFTIDQNEGGDWTASWKGVAGRIAKDVAAWVDANRERIDRH